jgi:tight adherence protein C
MNAQLLLGSLAVVAAVGLLWVAVSGPRGESVHLANGSEPPRRSLPNQESGTERALMPIAHRMGSRLRSLAPAARVRQLDTNLRQTGMAESWTIEKVLAAKVLLGFVGFVLTLLVFVDQPSATNLLLMVGATLFGFYVPNGVIDSRREARHRAIQNSLSDTIDQLNVIVRAGLGIDAALARLSRTSSGPLADEFARVLHDMRFGVARNVALANMAERVGLPELRGFVAALAQSDRLGVSVSQTLDVQARELRDRRKRQAEEHAMKLPVKILFPMVVCILPVLFIVLLGPAAIRIFEQFK